MELHELFLLQRGLDAEIHKKHDETYATTKEKRVLSLLVELGEFANETRTFKFWSYKAPSAKEVILDEYADALHFFLSLGLAIGIDSLEHAFAPFAFHSLTAAIIDVYAKTVDFYRTYGKEEYEIAFCAFLNLLPPLGYDEKDMFEAYKRKLQINYTRQENRY